MLRGKPLDAGLIARQHKAMLCKAIRSAARRQPIMQARPCAAVLAAFAARTLAASTLAGCTGNGPAFETAARENIAHDASSEPATSATVLAAGRTSGASSGIVTSILNAGVSAKLGDRGAPAKFLFDPLYDDHFGTLEPLDAATIDAIVTGEVPYDGVSAVFVSHAHGDHFSARHFNRLMAAQPTIQLVAPEQAVEMMREEEGWAQSHAARITSIALENGEHAQTFRIAGAKIEALRSPHAGWPDRHTDVHNITYRVSAATRSGDAHRIMHFGDASPQAPHLQPHAGFFAAARTGLAIVPFWFFGADQPRDLATQTLNAQRSVGMHVAVEEPSWLAGTGRAYFNGPGQVLTVPVTPEGAQ